MDTKSIPTTVHKADAPQRSAAPTFQVAKVFATPGASALMDKHHIEPLDLLRRHQQGDWCDLDKHDRAANIAALKDGSRLMSSYEIGHQKLWVITEAVGDDGSRASTCILLPSEY